MHWMTRDARPPPARWSRDGGSGRVRCGAREYWPDERPQRPFWWALTIWPVGSHGVEAEIMDEASEQAYAGGVEAVVELDGRTAPTGR